MERFLKIISSYLTQPVDSICQTDIEHVVERSGQTLFEEIGCFTSSEESNIVALASSKGQDQLELSMADSVINGNLKIITKFKPRWVLLNPSSINTTNSILVNIAALSPKEHQLLIPDYQILEYQFDQQTLERTDLIILNQETSDSINRAMVLLRSAETILFSSLLINESIAYAKQREQFGGKIANFQSVSHTLAEAYSYITTASIYLRDIIDDWSYESDPDLKLRMLHLYVTDKMAEAANKCLQVNGAQGLQWHSSIARSHKLIMFLCRLP